MFDDVSFDEVAFDTLAVSYQGVLYLSELLPNQIYMTAIPHKVTLSEYIISGAALVELSDSLMLEERMLNNVMLFEEKWII